MRRVFDICATVPQTRTQTCRTDISHHCKVDLLHTQGAEANQLQFCGGIIGASQSTTYGALMASRVVHAFGSSVCEALPVQLVNDIFFLHERGERIGYYTGI